MAQPTEQNNTAPAAEASAPAAPAAHITEDEASLYDRQIRLWGVEAQNRMRSSTVLVLNLRSLAHETIKNLVLAGIGRLIVMDGEVVTAEDLGGGFLFREEDGAVGMERTAAALPQIQSLNPLVSLSAYPTMDPFTSASDGAHSNMVEFLRKEKVDVVVACDMTHAQLQRIDAAAHEACAMFYGAGTYGFYAFIFADLGDKYEYVVSPKQSATVKRPTKYHASFVRLAKAREQNHWDLPATETAKGGSPFRGVSRSATRFLKPSIAIAILALWDFEVRHGDLPTGQPGQDAELFAMADEIRAKLGVNERSLKPWDPALGEICTHLAQHSQHFFPPTLAIAGGILAQHVLLALSRKQEPVLNLVVLDTLESESAMTRWGVGGPVLETEPVE